MTVCLDLSNEIEYLDPSIAPRYVLGGFVASLLSRLDGRLGKQARRWASKQICLPAISATGRKASMPRASRQAKSGQIVYREKSLRRHPTYLSLYIIFLNMLAWLPNYVIVFDFKGKFDGQAKSFCLPSACLLARSSLIPAPRASVNHPRWSTLCDHRCSSPLESVAPSLAASAAASQTLAPRSGALRARRVLKTICRRSFIYPGYSQNANSDN